MSHLWDCCSVAGLQNALIQGRDILQELIEARKEERKRKRAEGKGRAGAAALEEDVKLERADSGLGDLENGDGPDHRSVPQHTEASRADILQVLLGLRLAGHVTGAPL